MPLGLSSAIHRCLYYIQQKKTVVKSEYTHISKCYLRNFKISKIKLLTSFVIFKKLKLNTCTSLYALIYLMCKATKLLQNPMNTEILLSIIITANVKFFHLQLLLYGFDLTRSHFHTGSLASTLLRNFSDMQIFEDAEIEIKTKIHRIGDLG